MYILVVVFYIYTSSNLCVKFLEHMRSITMRFLIVYVLNDLSTKDQAVSLRVINMSIPT